MTDKAALLKCIRSFRKEVLSELDRLEDAVMSLADLVSDEAPATVQPDNDGWMTVRQVCEELHISDSTFYGWLNAGLLPEGVAFGARSKRWRMSDIRSWQKSKNHHDAVERPKTTARKRSRVSRVRKIEEFAYD